MNLFYFYFYIYVITSVLGCIVETIWCLLKYKKYENRTGLIYEPIIPVYGISGIFIVLIIRLLNLTEHYEIFIIGVLISSIVEFMSSYIQEKVFATKSWDYKDFPLNLNGRINLIYCILFGLITVILYYDVLVPLINFLLGIEFTKSIFFLFNIIIVFNISDTIISSVAVYRMKERRKNIERNSKFWKFIDKKYNDKFLSKVYPNMVHV